MVKVTIEHDEGTEVLESEAAFVVCMTAKDDDDGKFVGVQSGAWGDLPKKHPKGFIQASGDGMRGIIKAIGAAGVEDAELNFLIGFAGNTPDKKSKDSLYTRLRKFFRGKEAKDADGEN